MRIQSHRSAHTISLLCNPSPILPLVTSLTPHSSSLIPHLFSLLPHPSPLFHNLSSFLPPPLHLISVSSIFLSYPTTYTLTPPPSSCHLYPSSLILSPIPLQPNTPAPGSSGSKTLVWTVCEKWRVSGDWSV